MSNPEQIAADIAAMRTDIGWIKESLSRRELLCSRHMTRLEEVENIIAQQKGGWKVLSGLALGGGLIGSFTTRIFDFFRQ